MQKTREFQALADACTLTGCPLCRMAHESVDRYLDAWKYEHFSNARVREELRRTQGFCHTHTWQLVKMSATLQLALAYRDVLSDLMERLQRGSEESVAQPSSLLQRFFTAKREQVTCPACIQKEKADSRNTDTLRLSLLIEEFYVQFTSSSGLCIDHFQLSCTLKPFPPGNWLTVLQAAQLSCLQRLDEQLSEMIRKHDYRFKDEEQGEEMIAWRQAAGLVAGEDFGN